MVSVKCTFEQSKSLETAMNKVSEDNALGRELMFLANIVNKYNHDGEITPAVIETAEKGYLYTPLESQKKIQEHQSLLTGAENFNTVINSHNELPVGLAGNTDAMLQLIGATAKALHEGNDTAGIMGMRLLVKSGRESARMLQSMSLLYKNLPEYMLKSTLADIEAYNELNPVAQELAGGINPDVMQDINKTANDEALQKLEEELQTNFTPIAQQAISEAQADVVSVASQLGETFKTSDADKQALQATIKKAEAKLAKAEAEAETDRAKLKQLETQLAQATKAKNSTENAKASKLKDKRITALDATIAKLTQEKQAITTKLNNAMDRITQLEAGKASMQSLITEQSDSITTLTKEKQALESAIKEADAKLVKAETDMKLANNKEIKSLKATIRRIKIEKQDFELKLKRVTQDFESAQRKNILLRKELKKHPDRYNNLKQVKKAFDIDKQALANQLAKAQEKIHRLSDQLSNTQANQKAEILKAIEAIKAKYELPPPTETPATNAEEVQALKDRILVMGKKLKEAKEGNYANKKQLETKLKQLENDLKTKQKAIDALLSEGGNEETAQLTQDYNDALQRIAKLEEEIANYDPRQMLRNEMGNETAEDLANSVKELVANGEKDVAMQLLKDLPASKKDEVAKLLLC